MDADDAARTPDHDAAKASPTDTGSDAARTPDADADEASTTDRGGEAPHVRLELHVSRSRAYDAYVRDFGSWWQTGRAPRDELHVEQHAGGAIVQHANGEQQPWGEVHDVEPGHAIRHSYRHGGEHPATVAVEFHDGEHGGAVVELRHEPWEGSDDERAALEQAWTEALRRFEADATAV